MNAKTGFVLALACMLLAGVGLSLGQDGINIGALDGYTSDVASGNMAMDGMLGNAADYFGVHEDDSTGNGAGVMGSHGTGSIAQSVIDMTANGTAGTVTFENRGTMPGDMGGLNFAINNTYLHNADGSIAHTPYSLPLNANPFDTRRELTPGYKATISVPAIIGHQGEILRLTNGDGDWARCRIR